MAETLSISRAWDETKARIAADGRLLTVVALALVALPSALAQFLIPGPTGAPRNAPELVLAIIVTIIGLIGQLALIRLALGPSISVGEAIAHGARRAPAYVGSVLLLIGAALLIALPVLAVGSALGIGVQPGTPPSAGALLLILLLLAVLIYLAVRMLMTSSVASAEAAGPIEIIKRSWALTRGHWGRLFGFLLLFIVAVVIVLGAVMAVATVAISALVGEVEALSASALVLALIEALISALATTLFVVMLARIYVQLSGERLETSVPNSGT